jgi:O-antigen ligase
METILEPKEDYNWSDEHGRRQVWLRGMGYVAQFPVFGLGVNNFPRAEGTIGPLARTHVPGTPLRFIAPHNTPLQIATELGIPAFGVWVSVILLGIFWLPFQRRGLSRESDDPEERFVYHSCTYLPAAWVGFAASCVWVSFAYLVPYYLLLAYTAGVIVSLRRVRAGGTHARVSTAPRLAGPLPEWRSRRAGLPGPQAWQPRNAATRSRLPEPGDGLAPER